MRNSKWLKTVLFIVILTSVWGCSEKQEKQTSFKSELVIGNTKVTLVAVGKLTYFPDQMQSDKQLNVTPCLYISYILEYLGENEIEKINSGDMDILIGGKKIKSGKHRTVSRNYSKDYMFYKTSGLNINDPDKAFAFDEFITGVEAGGDSINIILKAGFNDKVKDFVFSNVPLS